VLSLVIPAHDEVARLGGTLDATLAWLTAEGRPAEVIVVDDGSTDGTAALVLARAAREPRLRLVRLPVNQGKGAAVRAGVRACRGDRVLFMDADLATPIAELDLLEAALGRGADVAVGSRALAGSSIAVRQHPLREGLGKSFNLLVRLMFGFSIRDTQCGFKLFTAEAARALCEAAVVDRFAFDVELLLRARGRFRVVEIPVRWRHVERSKVSPLTDAPAMARDLVRLWVRRIGR
jgi:glycosyltransferase involved in cell wall biosynthesis